MTIKRQDVVDTLIAGLRGTITSAQEVLDYKPSRLDGQTPVVVLESTGSRFKPLTASGVQAEHHFALLVLVRRSDPDSGWTEHDAEQMMNSISEQVKTFIETGGGNTITWGALEMVDGSSVAYFVPEGGIVYLQETYPLVVRVYQ